MGMIEERRSLATSGSSNDLLHDRAGELAKPTTMVLVHGAFAEGGQNMATP